MDPEMLAEMLYGPLFEKIWEEEEIPSDWKEGNPIKIPKKGDLGLFSEITEESRFCCNLGSIIHGHPGKAERTSGSKTPGPASWLKARQVMYRPDHNTVNHSRTVN